ncbi:MAG TPA: DUF559 domain-containing protein [Polyangiaceae bacterium]
MLDRVLAQDDGGVFSGHCVRVFEVDGGCHVRKRSADARRDQKLRRLGYRVLRLEAELVMRDLDRAVGRIQEPLAQSS